MCSVLFLPLYSVFKCFRSSHACHMCSSFLFLPLQSLLTCFKSFLTRFADFNLSLFSLITLTQAVRLFYVSLRSQVHRQQHIVLSFSSMQRHGHSHELTSSCALPYYTVGISFIRQSQTSKFDGKTAILHAPSHLITHYHYVRVTERYAEILHVEVYNVSNF